MIIMSITELKARFYEMLDRVKKENVVVVITRYGKPVAELRKHILKVQG